MFKFLSISSLIIMSLFVGTSFGFWKVLPVQNPSFEQDIVPAGQDTYSTPALSGWTFSSGALVIGGFSDNSSGYAYSNIFNQAIPDGNQFLNLRYTSQVAYQVTSHRVVAGETYGMQFSYGNPITYEPLRAAADTGVARLRLVRDPLDPWATGGWVEPVDFYFPVGTLGNWNRIIRGYTVPAAYDGWYLVPYFWHNSTTSPWYKGIYIDDVKLLKATNNISDLDCDSMKVNGYKQQPFDFDFDCVIDLTDLAVMATQWLSCIDPAGGEGCTPPWM